MFMSEATIDRTQDTYFAAFETPIVRRATDSTHAVDDEALMDAWLASLEPREFELILNRLAEVDTRDAAWLEPIA